MTNPLALNPVTTPQTPVPAAAGKLSGTSSPLASDFETFLKMLTAQAKNQDPLEPIDSTEYASQLAQFSMVEQQVQTNDSLAALSGQFGISNMASLAGWVGMEARAATPIHFDGTPVTISPRPAPLADDAFVVVTDARGQIVQRQRIPVSSDPLQWAGVGDDGTPLPHGTYSFEIESYKNAEQILKEPTEVYGRIVEAQVQDDAVVLVLEGGQKIKSTSITALRSAR